MGIIKEQVKLPENFDWEFYLSTHRDVAACKAYNSKNGAELHFLKWGYKEGRKYCDETIPTLITEEPIIEEKIIEPKKLTIVVPNKLGQTPDLTITSLYKQTFTNFDIIIINDQEGNANIARNEGLRKVSTPYVLFSDNDIIWENDAIEKMVDCLDNNPDVSIAYGSYEMEGKISSDREWDEDRLRKSNYISTMSMVRTDHHPGFDETIERLQDWDIWLTMLEQKKIGMNVKSLIFTTPKRDYGITGNSIPLDVALKIVKEKHQPKIENIIPIVDDLLEIKKPISIYITAYHSQDFIEDCLNSIENQTYFNGNDNFEVLVGIDGCQNTLSKLQSIRHKYRNLRVFMMKDNKGTYITSNTLLNLVKYENIIRFDSDDMMVPEMVEEILNKSENNDIIMFGYNFFVNNVNEINENSPMEVNSEGVIFYKRKIIDMTGGYRDWRCAADSEMLNRVIDRVEFLEIFKPLYYKRNQLNNLTNSSKFGWGSDIRNKYKKLCRHYGLNEDIKINGKTNDYTEIKEPIIGISFCIPAYKSQNFIEECLTSIEKQPCKKEILVGIDSCPDTLDKLKKISHKYENLKVFWFPKNMGTSIVKNTLATHAKYDIISFFDSDDIMNDEYSKQVIKNINRNNVIRFYYQDYNNKTKEITDRKWCANGIITLYKDNFFKLNGFWEYRVTEDWDFMERWKKIGEDTKLPIFGFKRRIHNNNISYDESTGCYGNYGENLLNISKERCGLEQIKNDELIISKCDEVNFTINDYFDKIYCLNLNRRKDKWDKAKKRFDELKIDVERFPAIDGKYLTDDDLIPYKKLNKFEVGCILSHYQIIKNAKKNHFKKILIFEDDVLFIDNFQSLFKESISKINEWKLLYLGGSQWQWGDIEFVDGFYYTNHTDGTFAYAIDESMYDAILNTSKINDKPIDFKLWDIQKKFYKQCYTCFPNLVISDVSSSDIRESREIIAHGQRMKWDLSKYKRK